MTTIVEGLPYVYDEKKITKAWKNVLFNVEIQLYWNC